MTKTLNFINNFLEKCGLFSSIKLEEVCLFVVSPDIIITPPKKSAIF